MESSSMAGAGPADDLWSPVKKDYEYEVEQHYGHSGITAWKEDLQETAWLQDYRSSERKPKGSAAPH